MRQIFFLTALESKLFFTGFVSSIVVMSIGVLGTVSACAADMLLIFQERIGGKSVDSEG